MACRDRSGENEAIGILPRDATANSLNADSVGLGIRQQYPPVPISKEVIRQYEDIGVHRLIPWLNAPTLDDTLRYVDELGALLSG